MILKISAPDRPSATMIVGANNERPKKVRAKPTIAKITAATTGALLVKFSYILPYKFLISIFVRYLGTDDGIESPMEFKTGVSTGFDYST